MNNFFTDFPKVSKESWINQIETDLKGKSPSLLEINDEVEELYLSSYYHHSEDASQEHPGMPSHTRGMLREKNNWNNGAFILIKEEKKANTDAKQKLMTGCNLIVFSIGKESVNWGNVLEGIQVEYIQLQIENCSLEDILKVQKLTEHASNNVQFNMDCLGSDQTIESLIPLVKSKQQRILVANGFGIQQSGATTWQEIAFVLNAGHEYLLKLMNEGLTIDEASACVSFQLGIGSNYFFEIGKIRAVKRLWSKIIGAYNPKHGCSYNCSITAIIGHTNKSLNDPYTNLLRQTTETLSALSAGVDSILVLPYDFHAKQGTSELSERMAINIPLILMEESYLDKVIDPSGGSYSIEQITDAIAQKAWTLFKDIETNGGLFMDETLEKFIQDVQDKSEQRANALLNNAHTLIGINKFM
ncbi:MAG: methylmalonyl-CoA mutase family protein, partial [Crocinitomicaceae bacterium]|nr:methylmalonyl-CoA mutase family protein [Crocinitomicaceae bacterium]